MHRLLKASRSYPKVEFSSIRYLANAYKRMWKVLMTSSVNTSVLFKMPYHVQDSTCPPKFTKSKPPWTLGLRNTPLKFLVPKPGGKCNSTPGEGSAVKCRSNGSIHCLAQRQTSFVYGITAEYLFFNRNNAGLNVLHYIYHQEQYFFEVTTSEPVCVFMIDCILNYENVTILIRSVTCLISTVFLFLKVGFKYQILWVFPQFYVRYFKK